MSAKDVTGAEIVKITINLVVIYLVGGFILAWVYAQTSPVIFKKNKEEKEAALGKMIPGADKIDLANDKIADWHPHGKHGEMFQVKKDGEIIGYIVESFGKGYSSYIDTLIALDTNNVIEKINILHHAETPGLGDEIEKEKWQAQFAGKTVDTLKIVKEESDTYVQAISGATISSRAVTEDAVRNGVQALADQLAGKGEASHGGAEHGEGGAAHE